MHFWDKFIALKDDRVPNIRIVVARAISRCILDKGMTCAKPFCLPFADSCVQEEFTDLHGDGLAALELFKKDRDREVRYFASREPLEDLPPAMADPNAQSASNEVTLKVPEPQEEPDLISA